jgi:uncharacterized membrane-anchored protein
MTPATDHPNRYALAAELHARPFAELAAPERVSHVAMLSGRDDRAVERAHLLALCDLYKVPPPAEDATHHIMDFGTFRLKWERHTEFTTYTFLRHGPFDAPFAETAADLVPSDWMAGLPGQRVVAVHVALIRHGPEPVDDAELAKHLTVSSLCRARVLGGAAEIATDYRINSDGFMRMIVHDCGMLTRQSGQLVQRLVETQTYRDMALLALPLARETTPTIGRIDAELATLTARMKQQGDIDDEQNMLDKLITLSTEIEESIAGTAYRFSAALAYQALIAERVAEIGEALVGDYPMPSTFFDRRFAPAMRTCEYVATRQASLSQRATRAANLLRTRVDLKLEQQNRDLLSSMDRRARLQLRLQQTVEGLSVAAITYYVASLLGYVLYATEAEGIDINVPLVQGLSVPVIAGLVFLGTQWAKAKLRLYDE